MAKPRLSVATLADAADAFNQQVNKKASQQADTPTSAQDNRSTNAPVDTLSGESGPARGKKMIGFRVPYATSRAIEKMAWDEELSVQALLVKAINSYRAARGLDPLEG